MGTTIQEQRNFHLEVIHKLGASNLQDMWLTPYSYGERGGCCVVCMRQLGGLHIELRLLDPVHTITRPFVHVYKNVGNMKDGYDLVPTDTLLAFDDTFKEKFFAALKYEFFLEEVV